jgi:2-dehydropantoate 2-reductase
MRIAVVGAGGVGGYFGAKLVHAGVDTVFLARGTTLEALRTRGIRVESIKGDFEVGPVQASDDPADIGPVDAVLVAVKAWQIEGLAPSLKPLLGPDTVVVPLENGMEAPDQLAAALGREHVAGGLCAIVSFAVSPGHIRHLGAEPQVVFGELDNRPSGRLERLRAAFVQAEVNADIPSDIQRSMWTKFLFIAPFSGVGAAARVVTGAWRTVPETRSLVQRAIEEVFALARARGVALAEDAVARTMGHIDNLPPGATSSLQRDVVEGKPSELDAQLGAAVRMSREAGVATPVCDFLYGALLPQERKARGG